MEVFPDILAEIDRFLDGGGPAPDQRDRLMQAAESILLTWVKSRNEIPTEGSVEGFHLLALHRQGCRGTPSFNACRETCREIVFRYNVLALCPDETKETLHQLRLMAMVVKHLALFVGGKLTEAGLGDFCCSSRPLHQAAGAA